MTAERTISISFRVTPRFRRLLVAAAERENRSQTNMLETLLLEFCAKHGVEESGANFATVGSVPTAAPTKNQRQKAKRQS